MWALNMTIRNWHCRAYFAMFSSTDVVYVRMIYLVPCVNPIISSCIWRKVAIMVESSRPQPRP
ncbi:hypothetical protein SAMN05216387_104168 [Nitrosovibrio tenuis]|uniref:Uncharacterized protein n=1 Tax=Nitrosovibrio tenuis TaxID=1233 RepID=A0A1H7LUF3_9PROT|nr:hypothetical protein SAMN05216387_104168 [Nitrosovibrio tenuis]